MMSSISKTGGDAVEAGKVFGLGQLEGDGDGAFLAFAAELGGGFSVEQQLQFVPVRPDEGGAKSRFAARGLRASSTAKSCLTDGLVFQANSSASRATRRRPGGPGARLRDNSRRIADDFLAGLDQFAGEAFQGRSSRPAA